MKIPRPEGVACPSFLRRPARVGNTEPTVCGCTLNNTKLHMATLNLVIVKPFHVVPGPGVRYCGYVVVFGPRERVFVERSSAALRWSGRTRDGVS